MHVDFIDFKDYVQEHFGKIFFVIGVAFLVVGVSTLTALGTELSAVSLFLGIVFAVFGIFGQIGLFSVNFRSWNGFGTILMCISVVFFAFSIAAFQFLDLDFLGYMQTCYRGRLMPSFRVFLDSERSYILLTNTLAQLGFVLLVAGILAKIYSVMKS